MHARRIRPRLEQVIPLADLNRLTNKRIILVIDALVVRFQAAKPAGHVLVEEGNDRVLRDVLDGICRGVRVGDFCGEVELGEPLVRGGEGLVDVGAGQVERVARLVDDDGEHVVLWVDEGDGAVELEGPAARGGGHVDDVPDPLAHLDGEFAELARHRVDGYGGLLVVAEDPGVAALSSTLVEC